VVRALQREAQPLIIDYGAVTERHLGGLVERIIDQPQVAAIQTPRWSALQLLAGDRGLRARLSAISGGSEVVAAADEFRAEIGKESTSGSEMELAEHRFNWITSLVDEMTGPVVEHTIWSDRVDRVLTNRYFGIPIFLVVMWIVLRITADVSAPFLDWVDGTVSGPIARWFVGLLGLVGLEGGWLESMVVDGVLAGVGGVLVFVPVLFSLYLCLAILEDSGYMARAAAVMDRAMRAVGIPGKAFLPMMVGFGCTVPAIYATRTLDSSRDRLLTGLITPFMSCGARLPVYVLLAAIFFADAKGTIVFGMYLLGILVAVLVGLLLSRTALREEEPSPFVMVMPDFRLPNARTVWMLVWQRTMAFVKGAGTTILLASMVVWLLLAIPIGGGGTFTDSEVEDSAFGVVAKGFAPVLEPAGFGEWEQSGALLTGFVAKEVVVSTMSQLYAVEGEEEAGDPSFSDDVTEIGMSFVDATVDTLKAVPGVVGLDFFDLEDDGDTALQAAVRNSFEESSDGRGSLAALAFMVFVLLYTPCMAAVGAFRHEFGAKWMWVSVIGQFLIAWAGAMIVFQGGKLIGLG
jgi:ferrous iron transport protein B